MIEQQNDADGADDPTPDDAVKRTVGSVPVAPDRAAKPTATHPAKPVVDLVVNLVVDIAADRILQGVFVEVIHHAFSTVRLRSSISPDRIPARAKNNTNIPQANGNSAAG